MKKLSIQLLAGLLLVSTVFMTSCDPEDGMTDLTLHFHGKVGTEDFALNQTYTINDSVAIQFSTAQLYAYGFNLDYTDGTSASFDDKYLLVKADQMLYSLGEVPQGSIEKMTFNVGVDTVNNHQTEENFTSRTSDDPLSIQTPPMHWNWNMGYIFVRTEGMYDADGDGTPETGFEYHVGMDMMHRSVEMTMQKELANAEEEIMIMIDWGSVFNGIDIRATPQVHGMDGAFMNNVQNAFKM